MSHNIKYADEALDCADCHASRSDSVLTGPLFTQKTPLYFAYDPEVESASYFDKKVDRAPTEAEFADFVQEELIKAGYPAPEEETTTTTTEQQEETTTSQEEATTGGGGGGCSMATTGGTSGILSFLITVSPLFLLRRRKKA
jgi:hypothetical protein